MQKISRSALRRMTRRRKKTFTVSFSLLQIWLDLCVAAVVVYVLVGNVL
ncbi:MAG: hypothetical protein GF398_15565 [Chitinivibrionales bacterium]|nr:hypothetical protein [Chitinivibrionales bacterium]